jgi:hypothetical protein
LPPREDRRPTVEQAGLTLAVEVPQTPLWVSGDATRLAEVLDIHFLRPRSRRHFSHTGNPR